MQTNTGKRVIYKVAEVNGFGEVYFYEEKMGKISGFYSMVEKNDRLIFE